MSVAARPRFAFENSFVRELEGLYEPWQATPAPEPRLLVLNEELAGELGLDADALREPSGVAVLAGNAAPAGATPVAQAYAGHQFGGYSPRLGDGRALLLGEVHRRRTGRRRDLHLKGSGRTPFARGGDGRAAVGPMLREYVIGEAMHALGIPTTRALAVVATGEPVARETHAAGRGARPRRGEPPPRRDVPVRRRAAATRRSCGASPTTRSPATTRTRPRPRTRTSRSSSASSRPRRRSSPGGCSSGSSTA